MSNRELRPYQIEAINAITTGLADGGSGQLHAACGSGKTIMAMRAAEQLTGPDGLVAVLTPSLALVDQIIDDWFDASRIDYQTFAVCSDEGVLGEDQPVATVEDLHAPVSTDPAQIAKWLTVEGPRLVVSTYQSAHRLAEAARRAGVSIGMLICDEAHHLAGNADAHTRRVVDPEILPARRRLYMTATPRNASTQDDETTPSLSMDDESVFGPVLYSYPFSRAIAEGYLEDYRIAVIGVSDRDVREALNRDDLEFTHGVGMRTAAAQVALTRAYQAYGMRRVISFHPRVEDARRFVETLPATIKMLGDETVPAPTCLHANGAMDTDQRRKALDGLRDVPPGQWAVCSNARCLSEGVDVPALDGILFANPKTSTVDIVQAASRALRKHPDTPGLSTIIVPVVVPDATDADLEEADLGRFEPLIRIVRSLRGQDDILASALNAARARLGVQQEGETVDEDLGPTIAKVEFHGLAPRMMAQVRLVVLKQTTASWWEQYAQLRAFREAEGRFPTSTEPVYNWLTWQRWARSHNRLPLDRVAALNDLGVPWELSTKAEARRQTQLAEVKARLEQEEWDRMFAEAVRFEALRGHLHVPEGHICASGAELGDWLQRQRMAASCGTLRGDRMSALGALGIVWNNNLARWHAGFEAAREYRARFGDLLVPARFRLDGYPLGNWIRAKRNGWRVGTLPIEHKHALDELGMAWTARGAGGEPCEQCHGAPPAGFICAACRTETAAVA